MSEADCRLKILHVVPRGLRGGIQSLIREIVTNSRHENVLCTWHTRGPLNNELEAEGYVTVDLSSESFPAVIRRLDEEVDAGRYDVVINHGFEGKQAIIFAKGKFKHCKIVQYLHSCYEIDFVRHRWLQPLLRGYTRRAYLRADATIAISRFVLDNHQSHFGDLKNPTVLYNAIDYGRFRGSSDIRRPLHDPMEILFLGRLSKEKGVQVLLSACAKLRSTDIPFNLTIAGWGDYEDELKSLAQELGVDARFVGETDKPEEYYASADVFAHCAIWEEGFGITLPEAMACGCICIASNIGGIPEVIVDGRDGYLAEMGNVDEFAALLANASRATAKEITDLRAAATTRAQEFTLDGYIERFDSMMTELKCNA